MAAFQVLPLERRHFLFVARFLRSICRITRMSASGGRQVDVKRLLRDSGHLLTAGHAATGCGRIIVSKEGNVVLGRIVAISNRVDLALIKVPKTLGLSAVFPRNVTDVKDMVFAAAYDSLPTMVASGRSARQCDRLAERHRKGLYCDQFGCHVRRKRRAGP